MTIYMTRNQLVDAVINHRVQGLSRNPDALHDMLKNGCMAMCDYDDEVLISEYQYVMNDATDIKIVPGYMLLTEQLEEFKKHVEDCITKMLDEIGDYSDKYNLFMTVDNKVIEIPMCASTYERLTQFLQEEIDELVAQQPKKQSYKR